MPHDRRPTAVGARDGTRARHSTPRGPRRTPSPALDARPLTSAAGRRHRWSVRGPSRRNSAAEVATAEITTTEVAATEVAATEIAAAPAAIATAAFVDDRRVAVTQPPKPPASTDPRSRPL